MTSLGTDADFGKKEPAKIQYSTLPMNSAVKTRFAAFDSKRAELVEVTKNGILTDLQRVFRKFDHGSSFEDAESAVSPINELAAEWAELLYPEADRKAGISRQQAKQTMIVYERDPFAKLFTLIERSEKNALANLSPGEKPLPSEIPRAREKVKEIVAQHLEPALKSLDRLGVLERKINMAIESAHRRIDMAANIEREYPARRKETRVPGSLFPPKPEELKDDLAYCIQQMASNFTVQWNNEDIKRRNVARSMPGYVEPRPNHPVLMNHLALDPPGQTQIKGCRADFARADLSFRVLFDGIYRNLQRTFPSEGLERG